MDKQDAARKTEPDPEAEALDEVVRQVSEDARKQPERYLKETEVPEGGE